jgi:hypothetical protein
MYFAVVSETLCYGARTELVPLLRGDGRRVGLGLLDAVCKFLRGDKFKDAKTRTHGQDDI